MRGKRAFGFVEILETGITPAHAGKTLIDTPEFSLKEDHPRACGENTDLPIFWATRVGSPPRMRGKLYKRLCRSSLRGITPAHAGKTR